MDGYRGTYETVGRIEKPDFSPRFVFVAVRHPANSPAPLTRHSPYCSDKLSRLALPSELCERHSSCGIRRLADGRALGASLAEAFGVFPI
jgi:hypothetical protein